MSITSNKPIKLLVISYALSGGGAERFTSILLNGIDKKKFGIQLCLLRNEITYPLPNNIPVTCLNKTKPWHLPLAIYRLRKLLKKINPDVVLSNIAYTTLMVGLANIGRINEFYWIARVGSNPVYSDIGWKRIVNNYLYPRVNKIICNSRGLASGLQEYYKTLNLNIDVLYNPVDLNYISQQANKEPEFNLPDKAPLIVAVGRFVHAKKIDLLLSAFHKVLKVKTANLILVGKGPLLDKIKLKIKELKIEQHVHIAGYCKNPYAIISRADLYVLSSEYEGLPNALIEAQALGIPAISTNCQYGPNEIIEEGVTGLIVPVNDEDALSQAIIKYLSAPERQKNWSLAARNRAYKLFESKQIIKSWENSFTT